MEIGLVTHVLCTKSSLNVYYRFTTSPSTAVRFSSHCNLRSRLVFKSMGSLLRSHDIRIPFKAGDPDLLHMDQGT